MVLPPGEQNGVSVNALSPTTHDPSNNGEKNTPRNRIQIAEKILITSYFGFTKAVQKFPKNPFIFHKFFSPLAHKRTDAKKT